MGGVRFASKLLFLAAFVASAARAQTTRRRPNIVVIMADDLGWADVGFRDPDMRTPNIDRMAREGVVLDQAYMNQVCSPSRAAFLSGKYPFRMGMQSGVLTALQNNSMPTNVRVLPQELKDIGYKNYYVGKWHLGFCARDMTPTGRGFDSFYGMYNGKATYTSHVSKWRGYDMHNDTGSQPGDYKVDWDARGVYSTNLFTDKAIAMLEQHDRDRPLFMVLSYQAVHGPLEVPSQYVTGTCGHVTWDATRQKHCALTAAMDEGIGNFTAALQRLGYGDDLITVMMTDNGGPTKLGSSNWPLRGGKITLWEGGTRAMTIIQSERHLPNAPYTWSGLHHAVDWYPTLLSAAGGQGRGMRGIDGVDNWRAIQQQGNSSRYEFVYNIDDGKKNNAALRYKQYKLIKNFAGNPRGYYNPPRGVDQPRTPRKAPKGQTWELFDLQADPTETTDISRNPDVRQTLARMKTKLARYRSRLVATPKASKISAGKPRKHGGAWVTGWCQA